MADDIDYAELVEEALRGVVRKVLIEHAGAGPEGLPGDCHFTIAFCVRHPGFKVEPSGALLPQANFTDEISIVLQHEFADLAVADDAFSVTLWFSGRAHRLTIPFAALTGFSDPSVPFGFRLEPRGVPSPLLPPGGNENGNVIDLKRRRLH
jgi:hypothetical protein